MIDIHTHILPNIDDGASDCEESFFLLDSLIEQGVKKLVFTPHFYPKTDNIDIYKIKCQESYNAIRKKYETKIEMRLGSEVAVITNSKNLFSCTDLKITGTNYILLELPFSKSWVGIGGLIDSFINDTALTPIIAHVELYKQVRDNPKYIRAFMNLGCAIQVDTESFLDKKTSKFVLKLAEKGCIDVLGSDTHSRLNRPPTYKRAVDLINSTLGEKPLKEIERRAEQIWQNESLRRNGVKDISKAFGIYY